MDLSIFAEKVQSFNTSYGVKFDLALFRSKCNSFGSFTPEAVNLAYTMYVSTVFAEMAKNRAADPTARPLTMKFSEDLHKDILNPYWEECKKEGEICPRPLSTEACFNIMKQVSRNVPLTEPDQLAEKYIAGGKRIRDMRAEAEALKNSTGVVSEAQLKTVLTYSQALKSANEKRPWYWIPFNLSRYFSEIREARRFKEIVKEKLGNSEEQLQSLLDEVNAEKTVLQSDLNRVAKENGLDQAPTTAANTAPEQNNVNGLEQVEGIEKNETVIEAPKTTKYDLIKVGYCPNPKNIEEEHEMFRSMLKQGAEDGSLFKGDEVQVTIAQTLFRQNLERCRVVFMAFKRGGVEYAQEAIEKNYPTFEMLDNFNRDNYSAYTAPEIIDKEPVKFENADINPDDSKKSEPIVESNVPSKNPLDIH